MASESVLPVNEVFNTIQGEATWTGTPSHFIRLQGCAVGCPWCDTKHTWTLDAAQQRPFADILAKQEDSPTYALATIPELVADALASRLDHVVITGGEPCYYDLRPLTDSLIAARLTVQIETSGTSPIRVHPDAWVTLSPKIDMPGGLTVLDQSWLRANEIKMPVGSQRHVHHLGTELMYRDVRADAQIWLQPLSMSAKATQLCIAACLANNWRLSVQTHKVISVR